MENSQNKPLEIKAALCHPDGSFSLESFSIDPPRENEALVRLVASGICHTDLDFCGGADGATILGHEGAGIVEQVGRAVQGIQKGDHVVMSYSSCGDCVACTKARPADCEYFMELNFGFKRLDGTSAYARAEIKGHFFGQSSFANYSVTGVRNLVKVDKSLPLETLAPLGCGLQTGAGTIFNSLDLQAGQSVAVFGVGSVGLAAIMAANQRGAAPIIAVDRQPERLKLARELGANRIINTSTEKLDDQLWEFAGQGLDAVVEDTGDPDLLETGLSSLKQQGRMALLTGAGNGDSRAFAVIQGDAAPQAFIPKLIQLWQENKFPIDRLITHYHFSNINKAIEDLNAGRIIKPVLVFNK